MQEDYIGFRDAVMMEGRCSNSCDSHKEARSRIQNEGDRTQAFKLVAGSPWISSTNSF